MEVEETSCNVIEPEPASSLDNGHNAEKEETLFVSKGNSEDEEEDDDGMIRVKEIVKGNKSPCYKPVDEILKEPVRSQEFEKATEVSPSVISAVQELLKERSTSKIIDLTDWNVIQALLTTDKGWKFYEDEEPRERASKKENAQVKHKKIFRSKLPIKEEEEQSNHECTVCNSNFISYLKYVNHLQESHNQFKCPYCEKFITQRSHLYRHIRNVHRDVENFEEGSNPLMCRICFRKFPSREHLDKHLQGVHEDLTTSHYDKENKVNNTEEEDSELDDDEDEEEEESLRCPVCYKVYRSQRLLRRHRTSMHAKESERVECIFCRKFYSNREFLNTHLERFHKMKSYTANGNDPPRRSSISQSEEEDDGASEDKELSEDESIEEPIVNKEPSSSGYPCPQCKERLKTLEELRGHLSDNHGFSNDKEASVAMESPETNTEGYKHFHSPRSHESLEEQNIKEIADIDKVSMSNRFVCRICFKTFKTRKIQRRHLRRIHKLKLNKPPPTPCASVRRPLNSGPKEFICYKCRLPLSTKSNLKRHIVRVHGVKAIQEYEKESNSLPSNQQSSSPTESSKETPMIAEPISTPSTSQRIVISPDSSSEYACICPHCKKGLRSEKYLREHVLIVHKGYKPFMCETCGMRFSKTNHLRSHIERSHRGVSIKIVKVSSPESGSMEIRNRPSVSETEIFHGFEPDDKIFVRKKELLNAVNSLVELEEDNEKDIDIKSETLEVKHC